MNCDSVPGNMCACTNIILSYYTINPIGKYSDPTEKYLGYNYYRGMTQSTAVIGLLVGVFQVYNILSCCNNVSIFSSIV